MMQTTLATSKSTAAVLKISTLNLLLPQGDIRTLESASDVDPVSPAWSSAGWIKFREKRWPVYGLSDELTLMQRVPAERRACAMLAMGSGYVGLLCDDIIVQKEFVAQRFELPVAMKFPDTPIMYLVKYEEGIACVSNASQLTIFIERLVAEAQ